MKGGTGRFLERWRNPALSQKISIIFAFFFFVSTMRQLVDVGQLETAFHVGGFAAVAAFVVLSFFDNVVIRYLQVSGLLVLGFLLILMNGNPSDVASFVFISIALAAAYKMQLFGRNLRKALLVLGVATILIAILSGGIHGFSVMQRINIANFIFAYLALLFVIFEEETLSLRKQRDILSRQADELRPFATLGSSTAGLVHDFKGDVAGLYALASLEGLADENETARRIQTYAERINRRVDAILDVATAADHYEPEEIDLSQLLQNVVYYFVEINRDLKHKVAIILDVAPGLTVCTRRNALMAILENVIKNSIEATEGIAERRVAIQGSQGTDEDAVAVTITHNGRNLPPGVAESGPLDVRRSAYFRRGKSTRPGGTGMGMLNVIRALEILDAGMTMTNLPNGVQSALVLKRDKPEQDAPGVPSE